MRRFSHTFLLCSSRAIIERLRCFYHLKNIIEKKGWKYPHAAYANNLAALSRLYDVAFKYDRSLDSGIDRVYSFSEITRRTF